MHMPRPTDQAKTTLIRALNQARARVTALETLEVTLDTLINLGFTAELTASGPLTLTVDLKHIHLPARGPFPAPPEIDAGDQPAEPGPPAVKRGQVPPSALAGLAGLKTMTETTFKPDPEPDAPADTPPASEAPKAVAQSGAAARPPKAKTKTPPLKSGPWSPDECARALKMSDAGASNGEIGLRLNRNPIGVNTRLAQLRRAAAVAPATPKPAPAAAPAPPPNTAPAETVLMPEADMSPKERRLHERLNALGYKKPWAPDLDLELVELLARGTKLGTAAGILEIDIDLVRLRWHQLNPDPSLENQERLLKALQRRAAMASG